VLPSGYRQNLRELAPDLWSIRSVSLDLDELTLLRRDEGASAAGPGLDRHEPMTQPPSPPTFFEEAQWREWERLQRSGTHSRDMLLVGWRATDAALDARQLQKAAQIAMEVLNLARWLACAGRGRRHAGGGAGCQCVSGESGERGTGTGVPGGSGGSI
jgi:hypothetical protein